jgi:hypothetical protein
MSVADEGMMSNLESHAVRTMSAAGCVAGAGVSATAKRCPDAARVVNNTASKLPDKRQSRNAIKSPAMRKRLTLKINGRAAVN